MRKKDSTAYFFGFKGNGVEGNLYDSISGLYFWSSLLGNDVRLSESREG